MIRCEKIKCTQNVGVVTQDSVLFSGSIVSFLTYGCQNSVTTMKDVIHAARQANAHGFIQEFPDKYETQVWERGIQLSGGQKQVRDIVFTISYHIIQFALHWR